MYQDPSTGNFDPWMNATGQVDPCDSDPGPGPSGVTPQTGLKYVVHVHPFAPYETLPTTCTGGRASKPYLPAPSDSDRAFLKQGIDLGKIAPSTQGIVMDKANIYRYAYNGEPIRRPRHNKKLNCSVM